MEESKSRESHPTEVNVHQCTINVRRSRETTEACEYMRATCATLGWECCNGIVCVFRCLQVCSNVCMWLWCERM